MPAGQANILIEKGADFIRSFTMRTKSTGTPTNLTGSSITFEVAGKQGGETIFSIPVVLMSAVNGTFEARYSKSLVDAITLKEGWFVINIVWSNGITERLVEGRVVISKGVL